MQNSIHNDVGPIKANGEVNEDYKYTWYENESEGIITKDLLDKTAYDITKKIINKLSSTQLRRFYFDVKTIEAKIKNAREADKSTEKNREDKDAELYKKYEPLIKMIKSKAAYASNPSKPKIPMNFKKFLFSCVNSIKNLNHFFVFVKYFEAVVGYIYGEEDLKKGGKK